VAIIINVSLINYWHQERISWWEPFMAEMHRSVENLPLTLRKTLNRL